MNKSIKNLKRIQIVRNILSISFLTSLTLKIYNNIIAKQEDINLNNEIFMGAILFESSFGPNFNLHIVLGLKWSNL